MCYVLIVEDDVDLAGTLQTIIERAGKPAAVCHDGVAALNIIETLSGLPWLVLTDWKMPLMGGAELVDRLRLDVRWADIPVVVLSGELACRAPADTVVLQKPVHRHNILDLVQQYCMGRRLTGGGPPLRRGPPRR